MGRTRGTPVTSAVVARPQVRDFTRAHAWELAFEARTAYDFIVSMSIGDGADSDLLPEDRAWLTTARDALEPGARAEIDSCMDPATEGLMQAVMALVVEDPGVMDAGSVLEALRAVGPRGVARRLVTPLLPPHVGPELLERVLDGVPGALEGLEEALRVDDRPAVLALLRDPDGAVERMERVLATWLPAFRRIEPRIARLGEADLASRAGDRAALEPDAFIERTTGGVRWFADPQVRRVIMAPSYFARPFNHVYQGADWRLFCYPVADRVLGEADPDTPPQSVIRLHRALGDASRLRILRLLRDRDLYLTELAVQLGLSKPTTKHHLALMRAAGLVTVTEEGGLTYYSLRRESLQEAGDDLRRYLG